MTLTPRQYEIACMAATQLPRAEIARRLGVSVRTIDGALDRAYHALGIHTRRDLAIALQHVTVRPCEPGGQKSRLGFVRGEPVRITGGRFAGRTGEYAGGENSEQIRVRIGGGVFALRTRYIERDAA